MSAKEGPASPVVLAGRDQWREWLCTNEDSSDGIWLMLAKKRVTTPTSLSYGEALDEALCSGWIDGQRNGYDERTYLQRFTPRRARSLWSRRNVEIAERLAADGRLRPRGIAEIERARSDGRWDRAYPGQATAQPPDALRTALEAAPTAKAAFDRLARTDRFSALLPLLTATNEDALERRVAQLISRLTPS